MGLFRRDPSHTSFQVFCSSIIMIHDAPCMENIALENDKGHDGKLYIFALPGDSALPGVVVEQS